MPPAPTNLVSLERVSVRHGLRAVLDAVSIGVGGGDRIGVVGRNGEGKSTLVRILAGDLAPHEGRVARGRDLSVALVAQHDALDPSSSVRAQVVGTAADHEWATDARAREVVGALLRGIDLDAAVGPLSGGERRRVALAAALLADADLLVLDEPTNHLDLEAITWLADHLATRFGGDNRRALVVVTHDRWFLDAVCERTWEVHDGTVTAYDGGYSAYVLARAERLRQASVAESRRQNLLRKELAWLRRGPPARTSKPKFRIDAANALIDDEPPPRDTVALSRLATTRLGRKVLELEDVVVERGGRRLLDGVTVRFGAGDRIGVLGPNGAGKTTLLDVLAGAVPPDAGRVERGSTVRIGRLAQERDRFEPTTTPIGLVEHVQRVRQASGDEVSGSQLLERLGFTGERRTTPVRDLSGGERRRLQVLEVLLDAPNVLLLDEPTNDLDIDTLTVLEDFLDGWAGTLVVVSHDRYVLERVCDTVWALPGDGTFAMLPGGVDEYLRRSAAASESPSAAPAVSAAAAEVPPTRSVDRRAARKALAALERKLARVAEREAAIHGEMATYASDYERLGALDAERRALVDERSALEDEWLELAESAEAT